MALESCAAVCVANCNEHIVLMDSGDELTTLMSFILDCHWNILCNVLLFL